MGTALLSSCLLFCLVLTGFCAPIEFPNHTYVEPEYLENLLANGQYEEFAKLLLIDDVNLVKPVINRIDNAEGNHSVDPMFNKGLKGGDILLRPSQREKAKQSTILSASEDPKWKWNRVVPYTIDNRSYSKSQKKAITEAINQWNQDFSNHISYEPRSKGDQDYVMFFSGNGCYSYLGRVGGQQPISLQANGCLSPGTILHEMSHAIGFIHQHTRPDRDNYIKILPQNIPEEWKSQYEKYNYGDIQILGPYDYYSVMHYPIPAPGTNKPAFEVLKKDVDLVLIGQRLGQTHLDKEKVKRMYS